MKRLLLIAALILLILTQHVSAQDGPVHIGVPETPQQTSDGPTYEEQVLAIVNQERWQNGQLPPLKSNPLLDTTAETHSTNMALRNFFAHCDLDTKASPWDRMHDAGYDYNYAGENIAAGYSSPASVMNGWMNSSGHRANILGENFREIGVGFYYQSGDQGNIRYDAGNCIADSGNHGPFGNYWTQNFGRRTNVYPVVINREAYETESREVALYMYGTGWATEMRFQNSNGVWSDWQPYQSDVNWTLSSGNGLKTVHAEIRNSAGTVLSASDTIMLNGRGPVLSVDPPAIAFVLQPDGPNSAAHTLTISNAGQEAMAWNIVEQPEVSWLSLSTNNSSTDPGSSSSLAVIVSRIDLAEGAHTTTLLIDAGEAEFSPQTISVTFLITDKQLFLPTIKK